MDPSKLRKHELLARVAELEATCARLTASERPMLRDPRDAVTAIRAACGPEQETFVAVCLNSRLRPLATYVVAIGTVGSVDVHPRDVFRAAIRMNAHSLVIGHNHPSGDPTPSQADLDLTARLRDAGTILGIPVLDHVIVTRHSHVSLAEQGLMGGTTS
jgi:DNA repair protein RadC